MSEAYLMGPGLAHRPIQQISKEGYGQKPCQRDFSNSSLAGPHVSLDAADFKISLGINGIHELACD